jgi:hypothetical protein
LLSGKSEMEVTRLELCEKLWVLDLVGILRSSEHVDVPLCFRVIDVTVFFCNRGHCYSSNPSDLYWGRRKFVVRISAGNRSS